MGSVKSKNFIVKSIIYNNNHNINDTTIFKLNDTIKLNKVILKKNTLIKLFEFNSYGLTSFNEKTYKIIVGLDKKNYILSNNWYSIQNKFVSKL